MARQTHPPASRLIHGIASCTRLRSRFFGLLCLLVVVNTSMLWAQATITAVNVLNQSNPSGSTRILLVEIVGTGLLPNPAAPPSVVIVPGVLDAPTQVNTPTDTLISAKFTVPQDYQLSQVALSYPNGGSVSKDVTTPPCRDTDIVRSFNFVASDKVKNTFGNGVAKSFHVVKVSIVNKCSQGIIVPLAGVALTPLTSAPLPAVPGSTFRVPYSLAQVTAVYSTDRKLTGTRAICFNILAALATLGSSVQPFFGPGFTQGVAILGGGFTQAANTIFKDLSPEQLQNIASLSFGDTEQVASNSGSVNKYVFLPRHKHPENDPFLTCAHTDGGKCTAYNPPIDGTIAGTLTWATVNIPSTGALLSTPAPAAAPTPAPAAAPAPPPAPTQPAHGVNM